MEQIKSDQELSNMSAVKMIFWTCVAEVLLMQGIFTFSSMLPFFFTEWHLDSVDAGWISGIYFGAYMVSVVILVSITDWIDAKKNIHWGSFDDMPELCWFCLFCRGILDRHAFQNYGWNWTGRNIYARSQGPYRSLNR